LGELHLNLSKGFAVDADASVPLRNHQTVEAKLGQLGEQVLGVAILAVVLGGDGPHVPAHEIARERDHLFALGGADARPRDGHQPASARSASKSWRSRA
jgi:hypothetical protein